MKETPLHVTSKNHILACGDVSGRNTGKSERVQRPGGPQGLKIKLGPKKNAAKYSHERQPSIKDS